MELCFAMWEDVTDGSKICVRSLLRSQGRAHSASKCGAIALLRLGNKIAVQREIEIFGGALKGFCSLSLSIRAALLLFTLS